MQSTAYPHQGLRRCTDPLVAAWRNRSRGKGVQMARSDVLQLQLKRSLGFLRRQAVLKESLALEELSILLKYR